MKHSQTDRLHLSFAVIIPTYNNSNTLSDILARLERLGLPLFVINDGSTDETAQILAKWQDAGKPANASKMVFTHNTNCGKAAALQTGFAAAATAGYTHAVTIDSDGQLDPEQIPDLLAAARACPEALVVGVRDSTSSDYPAKSRLGRNLSNFFIFVECGHRVEDSQCGFRIYPLAMVNALKCKARRYGYETEIITRAVWSGWQVREVPVVCRYFPQGEKRVSHFRPWLDTVRSVAMHARLLLLSRLGRPRQKHIDNKTAGNSFTRSSGTGLSPEGSSSDKKTCTTGRSDFSNE
jgi:glycosyltransferase involved in cell wall biosynthesis